MDLQEKAHAVIGATILAHYETLCWEYPDNLVFDSLQKGKEKRKKEIGREKEDKKEK